MKNNSKFKFRAIFNLNLTSTGQKTEKTIDLKLQHQLKMSDVLYETNVNHLHKIDPTTNKVTNKLRSKKYSKELSENKIRKSICSNSNTFFQNQKLMASYYNRNIFIDNNLFDKEILKKYSHAYNELNVVNDATNGSHSRSQSLRSIASKFVGIENQYYADFGIDENIVGDENKPIQTDENTQNHESEVWNAIEWKPAGLTNSNTNRFLNSVIQIFASCLEFRAAIEGNQFTLTKIKDALFIQAFVDLIRSLKSGNKEIINQAHIHVQNCIDTCFGDDPYKCIMNILNNLNNLINQDTAKDSKSEINTANESFENTEPKIPITVFNNFNGQIVFRIFCVDCGTCCQENLQEMKSLLFPVSVTQSTISLQERIKNFFKASAVECSEICGCGSTNFISDTKLILAPKYLFIYLNKCSCISSVNIGITILSSDIIKIESNEENVLYKLISVIDERVINGRNHYCCKCSYEKDTWWLLNDENVKELSHNEIISQNSIIFLFKRYS